MKKKLIIIVLLGGILSVIIYFYLKNDEITITAIGDGLSNGMTPYNIEGYSFNDYLKEEYIISHKLKNYIYEFASAGITTKELIYDIKENKELTIKNEPMEIQRAINEADILTIAIGMDELMNTKLTREAINEFKNNLKELFGMIKMLNQNKIYIIGLYENKFKDALTINKINAIIRDTALTNGFVFVDITKIAKPEYFLATDSYYLNYNGHKAIYKEIKKLI